MAKDGAPISYRAAIYIAIDDLRIRFLLGKYGSLPFLRMLDPDLNDELNVYLAYPSPMIKKYRGTCT